MEVNSELFAQADEKVVAALGNPPGSVAESVTSREAAVLLTNRRLYQFNAMLVRTATGGLKKSAGTAMVQASAISASSFTTEKNGSLFAGGVFMILFSLINVGGLGTGENFLTFLSVMGLILLVTSGVVCILTALIRQRRVLIVEHAGGMLAIDCRAYPPAEVAQFQRAIARAASLRP